MLLQCGMKAIIWADFKINQDYIAKNLCENRTKPKLKCKGNCQLMKALKKEAAQEQQSNNSLKNKFEVLYFEEIISLIFNTSFSPITESDTQYLVTNYACFQNSIFHPPAIS